MNVFLLLSPGTKFLAGTSIGVFRSTDNGTSWTPVNIGLTDSTSIYAFTISGPNLYANTSYGFFLSTNNGTSWTQVNFGLNGIFSLTANGINLFALAGAGGVYVSTDNGTGWTQINSGLSDSVAATLFVTGTNLFVEVGHYVYSHGEWWFVSSGVCHSTNNGTSWTPVNSGFTHFSSMVVNGINLFAGAPSGVFLSTDNGSNWNQVNSGLADTMVTGLSVSGTNLFVGSSSHGVWRRPLSEMITSVPPAVQLPREFVLDQNYPNPFNPFTTIRYDLPHNSFVTLTVYNTLGQQVAQLVKEQQQAGYHDVVFRGDGLASGVYFYRLQAGSFVDVKKLLLLK